MGNCLLTPGVFVRSFLLPRHSFLWILGGRRFVSTFECILENGTRKVLITVRNVKISPASTQFETTTNGTRVIPCSATIAIINDGASEDGGEISIYRYDTL